MCVFYCQMRSTALYIAAQEGHLPALQLLLDQGAAIEAQNSVSQRNDLTSLYLTPMSYN